jgi:hypothetical protein
MPAVIYDTGALLRGCRILPDTEETARAAGAAARMSDVVDAIVVATAVRLGNALVVTTDPNATYLRTFPQVNGPSGDTRAPHPPQLSTWDAGSRQGAMPLSYAFCLFRAGCQGI